MAVLGLEAVFEMPNQERRKSQRELSPASIVDVVDVVQFARNCHRKTFVSRFLPAALHFRMHNQLPFSYLSRPSSNLGENISDIVDDRQRLSVWHGIDNWESMGIPNER
jgi:hypothetical protein